VNRKYVDISGRVLPLKIFFARGTATAGSSAGKISTDKIRKKISEIVDSEDKADPLKDGEIARELKKSGYDISRRTVSKYRGILRIETAGRRKRKSGPKKPSA
jgi:RNA polymerase sigma-54 factor